MKATSSVSYKHIFSVKNNPQQTHVKLFTLHNRASRCELRPYVENSPALPPKLDPYLALDWIRQCELNIREHC